MAEVNIYEEMKNALTEFKGFLDDHINEVKAAVDLLRPVLGEQINQLVTALAEVLGKIRTKIQELDVNIQGFDQVTSFTSSVTKVLEASKNLVPDLSSEVDAVLGAAQVVSSLPSLGQIKQELLDLLQEVINHVNSLATA